MGDNDEVEEHFEDAGEQVAFFETQLPFCQAENFQIAVNNYFEN